MYLQVDGEFYQNDPAFKQYGEPGKQLRAKQMLQEQHEAFEKQKKKDASAAGIPYTASNAKVVLFFY